MNNIVKSVMLATVLAGSALALTPQEKLDKLNVAFSEGNIAEGARWGHEMLRDGDAESVRLVAQYMADCGYAPELREAALKKAAELDLNVEEVPTEGAPWRLNAIALVSEYEDLSNANDAAGICKLGMELYKQGEATRRYGIGLLYVAASMNNHDALRQLAGMYRKGQDVPRDAECAEYLTACISEPSTCSNAALYEVFSHCLGNGGTPDIIRERGVDFAEGRNGVKTDEKAAIILYRVAADMGDATAARWLGWRFLQGRGVGKSLKLARQYFTIAALQGDPRSGDALKQHFNISVEASQ